MSNAPEPLQELNRRCFGRNGLCTRRHGGIHAHCLGRVAQRAAIFQEQLCVAILRGLRSQLTQDRRVHDGEVGVHEPEYDGSDEIDMFQKRQQNGQAVGRAQMKWR